MIPILDKTVFMRKQNLRIGKNSDKQSEKPENRSNRLEDDNQSSAKHGEEQTNDMDASELFSQFTANIIKEDVVFTR